MIDKRLAELDEMLEVEKKSTEKPWNYVPADESDDWMIYNSEFTFVKQDDSGVPVSKEDGDLIVLAANNFRRLAQDYKMMLEALEKINKEWGTDHCDGNTMIAHECLEKVCGGVG